MTRILCLGNNSEDTDRQTRLLASQDHVPYHGLLSELDKPFSSLEYSAPGYYHSSVVDLQPANLKWLIEQFDQVIMLDQPLEHWNHPNQFVNTIRIIKSTNTVSEFKNAQQITTAEFFLDLVESNKSFCVFPFIEFYTEHNHAHLCCQSHLPVKPLDAFENFHTDTHYQAIREKMLEGTLLPEYCGHCYELEQSGRTSPRTSETLQWIYRLGINNITDLKKIQKPAYYDIRPSNKCNLTCRTCGPQDSHLIAKEYHELKIYRKTSYDVSDKDFSRHQAGTFDLVEFDNIHRLLVAGGEPTIMPEFFSFLERCIDTGHTDFEIQVTTNGTTCSDRLKTLVKNFSKFFWVFSIDGFQDLNHYIRYPSDWSSIINNWRYHLSANNTVTLNTTISIYNINTLDMLFEFVDQQFPNTYVNTVSVNTPSYLSPLLFPDRDSVLRSLERAQKTHCYKNSQVAKSNIDYYLGYFQDRSQLDLSKLKTFFEFNDMLDQNRKIYLRDHVHDLEKYRRQCT